MTAVTLPCPSCDGGNYRRSEIELSNEACDHWGCNGDCIGHCVSCSGFYEISLSTRLNLALDDGELIQLDPPADEFDAYLAAVIEWANDAQVALEWSRGLVVAHGPGNRVVVELRQPSADEEAA